MDNFSGIKIDTTNMDLKELEEIRKQLRDKLFQIEYQISLLKKSASRDSSEQSDSH